MAQTHLEKISVNESAGPDGINAQLLKIIAPTIAAPFALLFSYSLKCAVIPSG